MNELIEVPQAEHAEVLRRTRLDLQLAGARSGEVSFFAAHGRRESFYVLADKRQGDVITVWTCTDPCEAIRRGMATRIRAKFAAVGY